MLAMGRYAQWQSRFLRYIDTRPNGDALRKCILQGAYTPSTVTIPAILATDDTLAVPEQTAVETILNMSPENKAHYESEKEVIHLLLIGMEMKYTQLYKNDNLTGQFGNQRTVTIAGARETLGSQALQQTGIQCVGNYVFLT
ncbi:hypothetical protein Tco_1340559 [Tanacetum coccineum]